MTIPPEIEALHRALLAALRVDYFPPGMGDLNAWHDFLFVLSSLDESAGGPLTGRDLHAVVALMREQNRENKAKWALRFMKILRDPEMLRDLVLETRRVRRPRRPVETTSVRTADGAQVEIERDPAADADARPVQEILADFKRKMNREPRKPGKDS